MKKEISYELPKGKNHQSEIKDGKLILSYDNGQLEEGTMFLEALGDAIFIKIGGVGVVGHIYDSGKCCILNTEQRRECFKQWNGKCSNEIVEFMGQKFMLIYGVLTEKITGGGIFDFNYCTPYMRNKSKFIKKYPNGTPILH